MMQTEGAYIAEVMRLTEYADSKDHRYKLLCHTNITQT